VGRALRDGHRGRAPGRAAAERSGSRSDALGAHLAGFTLERVPRDVAARAKLVLLDTLGGALAASPLTHRPVRLLAELVRQTGGVPESSLIGQGRRAAAADAAFLNAALAAFGLTDPLHVETTLHAPAVVAGAALAAAERAGASGRRFFEAFILGIETACRIGAALDPKALYARALHPTGVCGTFGAAAAAAHALGLPAAPRRAALGLALQHATGSLAWVTDSSDGSRILSPALGARQGVQAALLAALGLDGPPAPFDGPESAFVAFSGRGRPEALLEGWGDRFYLRELTHKRHASCSHSHAALDAALALVQAHALRPRAIAAVTVRCAPSIRPLLVAPALRSCFAPYLLALALVRGRVTIDDAGPGGARTRAIDRLARAVRVVEDPSLESATPDRGAAIVEIETRAGARLVRRVDAARGSRGDPLSPAELRAKFLAASAPVLPARRAASVVELVDRLEAIPRVGALAASLRGRRPARPRLSASR
jgi:2-methylcitrate dehydratase PrpD